MNTEPMLKPEANASAEPHWFLALIGGALALFGGFVTAVFAVFLGANLLARISGGQPKVAWFGLMIFWGIVGAAPLLAGLGLLKSSRDHFRFWNRILITLVILSVLSAIDTECGPTNYHALFRRDQRPPRDASELARTVVSPVLRTAISPGTNVLWCGTFQLVWNETCKLTGGDMAFVSNPPVISILNEHPFTKEYLDEPSYLAMAGFVRDGILRSIPQRVNEKFHGTFQPRLLPKSFISDRPQDVVAYACLYKRLKFAVPFEREDDALTFEGAHVRAFGTGNYSAEMAKRYPQIVILDYQDENDFVIELKTEPPGNRLFLAKIKPKTNLEDTMFAVLQRAERGTNEIASTNDVLRVPRIQVDVTKQFDDLMGLHLVPASRNVANDLRILSAVQSTTLDIDEKGVELKSEAQMRMGCASEGRPPVRKHKMVFDQPFLVLLKRDAARMPYCAVWVSNPELLVKWK